jgi:hypothetical protein
MALSPSTEGDRRTNTHSWYCQKRRCADGPCRCWCHGVTKHLNGDTRPDAPPSAAAPERSEGRAAPTPQREEREE